ncbi:MAG TPA: nuclear transport factor 2 family protein [Candidatus Methylacidiphilales bacterium]|nr:nuclear transport factor 2 family protein [Candidatus Methylacidiphilales bacterium]
MSTSTLSQVTAQTEIAEALASWTKAFCSKDLDSLMSHYADDVVEYDVKPPLQNKGSSAVRQIFADCFPCFPENFSLEIRDQYIHAGDDVAAIHRFTRVVCDDKNHPAAQNWLRVTAVYRKLAGQWKIVHDHVSFTFDFSKGQIAFGLQP